MLQLTSRRLSDDDRDSILLNSDLCVSMVLSWLKLIQTLKSIQTTVSKISSSTKS